VNTASKEFRCTIVSFESLISDPACPGLWTLVQKFSSECTAIIVDRPEDELAALENKPARQSGPEQQRIEREILKRGLSSSLHMLPFEEALLRLQAAREMDVSVILQPHHPLDRQAPGFRRLSRAAYEAKGATIYFPEQASISGDYLLLAGRDISEDALAFAQGLSERGGLELEVAGNISDLGALKNRLLALPSAARPALVFVNLTDQNVRPVALMKLAAVTGVAVLSYKH